MRGPRAAARAISGRPCGAAERRRGGAAQASVEGGRIAKASEPASPASSHASHASRAEDAEDASRAQDAEHERQSGGVQPQRAREAREGARRAGSSRSLRAAAAEGAAHGLRLSKKKPPVKVRLSPRHAPLARWKAEGTVTPRSRAGFNARALLVLALAPPPARLAARRRAGAREALPLRAPRTLRGPRPHPTACAATRGGGAPPALAGES
jgi:hypothetical protein